MRVSVERVCFYCGENPPTETIAGLSLCRACAAHERAVQQAQHPVSDGEEIVATAASEDELRLAAFQQHLQILNGTRRRGRAHCSMPCMHCAMLMRAAEDLRDPATSPFGSVTEASLPLGMPIPHRQETPDPQPARLPDPGEAIWLVPRPPVDVEDLAVMMGIVPVYHMGPSGLVHVTVSLSSEDRRHYRITASDRCVVHADGREQALAAGEEMLLPTPQEMPDSLSLLPMGGRGNAQVRDAQVRAAQAQDGGSRVSGGVGAQLARMMRRALTGNEGRSLWQERVRGPVRLPDGMPSEIATHGAPVDVDPCAMGAALLGLTDSAPKKCIQGDCGLSRSNGHAFCTDHLLSIKVKP